MRSSISLIFGSQTGNAEYIAAHISHEASSRGYTTSKPLTLDDFSKNVDTFSDALLIFVTSTTGDGDPPDNSTKFWRSFRRTAKEKLQETYSGRSYALLGLGDTNYSNFNNSAIRLDRKLVELGAVSIIPKGLADDATGLEAVVEPWIESLFEGDHVKVDPEARQAWLDRVSIGEISSKAGMMSINGTGKDLTPPVAKVDKVEVKPEIVNTPAEKNDASKYSAYPLELPKGLIKVGSEETPTGLIILPVQVFSITPTGESLACSPDIFSISNNASNQIDTASATSPARCYLRRVKCVSGPKALDRIIQIELDTKTSMTGLFVPGDSIGVFCPNPDFLVDLLNTRLGLDPQALIKIASSDETATHLSDSPITYSELFKYYLDITGFPKRQLFRIMAEYTSDENERSSLLLLSSTAGTPVLKGWRMDQAPTLLDILATFPNTNPPVDRLVQVLARLQPRYYSIAGLVSTPSIVFNVAKFTDGCGREMKGLASGWMDSLTGSVSDKDTWHDVPGDVSIPIFKKQSGYFSLPMRSEEKRDMMMVATGTGIAPFIPFLEVMEKDGFKGTSVWLVYGARFLNDDFLFKEYLTRLAATYPKNRFRLDFCASRESEENVYRGYVHDFFLTQKEDVGKYIENGNVFVCGSMKMAKSLDKTLAVIIESLGKGDGKDVLKRMRDHKRYIREIWG